VLGWRALPVDPDGAGVGETAMGCMPYMAQLFLAAPELNGARPGGIDLDRRVYPVRKLAEQGQEETQVYFASLSSRTIAYKGMLTTLQLPQFFPDLRDAHRGASLIVWAVAEGRSAAHAVDAYLMEESDLPAPVKPSALPLAVV
jgi:glutamate synthase (NADPH) large chain